MKVISLTGIATLILALIVFFVTREPDTTATTQDREQHANVSTGGTGINGPAVQVVTPQRQDMVNALTIPANVAPWAQATLYAKVSGYLASMEADKGDRVRKGQLLAVIDAPEINEQYEQAEAQHAIKRVTAARLSNVWRENADVIAKQDVDVAEAEAKAAKHMADSRRTMLGYTKVYAPFSGVITARFADPGVLIQSATTSATQTAPLFTIMDIDKVRVYAGVPQEAARFAKPGTPVVLSVKETPDKEIQASITRTTHSLDPATRTLLVEIDLPNENHQFQPGMYINAKLLLERHADALTLPSSAILSGKSVEGPSVFIVENNVVRRVPIRIGLDDGVHVEVVEGLRGDEEIVAVGKSGLSDGKRVKVSPYNFPAGMPARQKT